MSQPDIQVIMNELASMRDLNAQVHTKMFSEIKDIKDLQDSMKEKNDEMYKVFTTGSGFITVLKILGMIAVAVGGFLLTVKQLK